MYKRSKTSIKKLFFICYLLLVVNSFFFQWTNNYLHCDLNNPIFKHSIFEQVILGAVIGPVIETWVFQYLLNKIILWIKPGITNRYILLIVPSLIFGIAHVEYSWLYGLVMVFSGLLFNFFFLETKPGNKYFFWLTALLHGLYNLLGIILFFLFS
jgi:hypothetical protein